MISKDSQVQKYRASQVSRPAKEDYFQFLEVENSLSAVTKEQAIEKIMITSKAGYEEAMRIYNELIETGDKFKVNRSINVRAVQNSLDNIFQWIPGERILDPEFGSKLRYYLYEGITQFNQEQITSEIRSCVMKYDPRVIIDTITNRSTIDDTEDNTIVLDISYHIKGLPDKIFNKQYIFNRSDN